MIGTTLAALAVSAKTGALAAVTPADVEGLEHMKVDLVAPPMVHAHEQATSGPPKVVEFFMQIEEKQIVVDGDGTKMWAMTYNGSIPGPLMVVHEGDYVQLTLVNPETNEMPHNIDFHAATGCAGRRRTAR